MIKNCNKPVYETNMDNSMPGTAWLNSPIVWTKPDIVTKNLVLWIDQKMKWCVLNVLGYQVKCEFTKCEPNTDITPNWQSHWKSKISYMVWYIQKSQQLECLSAIPVDPI